MFCKNLLRMLLLSLLVCPVVGFAEDESRGRLPDGRAFRRDAGGNEIVDYIAELETTNDALNRRIYGLEGELEEKGKLLQQLQNGGAPAVGLVERELIGGRAKKEDTERSSDSNADLERSRAELTELRAELASLKSVDRGRAEEQLRLEDLQAEIDREKVKQAETAAELSRVHALLKEEQSRRAEETQRVRALETTLSRKGEELTAAQELQFRQAIDSSAREISSLNAKVSGLEELLLKKDKEIESLNGRIERVSDETEQKGAEVKAQRTELTALREQFAEQSGALDEIRKENTELKGVHAASLKEQEQTILSFRNQLASKDGEITSLRERVSQLSSAPLRVVVKEPSREATVSQSPMLSQSFGDTRQKAMDALKMRLVTQLGDVRDRVSRRDALFAQYARSAGRKVNFKPTPALSSRGLGSSEVAGRLKAITSVIELAALGRDLQEIRVKVEDDIRLIERMQGVKQ